MRLQLFTIAAVAALSAAPVIGQELTDPEREWAHCSWRTHEAHGTAAAQARIIAGGDYSLSDLEVWEMNDLVHVAGACGAPLQAFPGGHQRGVAVLLATAGGFAPTR